MFKSSVIACLATLWLILVSQAVARDLSQDEALKLRKEGKVLASQTFIERALERHPNARLLELELEEKHGRYVYEVELLTTHGQVRELKFDAINGELLEDEEDD